ncbi:MAG: DUF4124 domain-containing protein [Gammaproteobacteria bacterium]|nr:DUF4124 domain-containing protein [Gammaproteobacteria bacterium]
MSFSKRTFIQFILVFALGLLSLNAYSIYKWKDANGNIQYTEYPPPTGDVEILKPPSISTVGAQKSEQPSTQDKNENKGETKPNNEKQPPADPKTVQAMKQKNCETAKKNLDTYMRTKKIRDKDGNVVRISDEDWQNRVDETQKKIEEYCN